MLKKFNKVLNKVFLFCPKTKEMLEFREELLGTLMEKYQDYINNGLSNKESFDKCVEGIEEYKPSIKEFEKMQVKKKSKDGDKMIFNAYALVSFIFATLIIYFVTSYVTKAWNLTWLTFIGATIVALLYGSIYFFIKGQQLSRYKLVRFSIWLFIMLLTLIAYLTISFTTNQWKVTWLAFIIGITLSDVVDIIYRMYAKNKIYTGLDAFIVTMLETVMLYLTISVITGMWAYTWVIFLVGIFFYTVLMAIRQYIIIGKK